MRLQQSIVMYMDHVLYFHIVTQRAAELRFQHSADLYSSLVEIRSSRVRKGTLVILWLSDRPEPDRPEPDWTWTGPGPEWHTRSKGFSSWIMDHGSWIKDHGSKIKDQRSMIKYQWSKIKYHGSKIKYQVSSIKYQVSNIKDQGAWTLDLAWMAILDEIPTWDQDHPNLLSKIYHFK